TATWARCSSRSRRSCSGSTAGRTPPGRSACHDFSHDSSQSSSQSSSHDSSHDFSPDSFPHSSRDSRRASRLVRGGGGPVTFEHPAWLAGLALLLPLALLEWRAVLRAERSLRLMLGVRPLAGPL